jgi:hypothetical protein
MTNRDKFFTLYNQAPLEDRAVCLLMLARGFTKTLVRKFFKPEAQTKFVKVGGKAFEIPAHMDIATMVTNWQDDSREFDALARTIVKQCPRFAYQLVSEWLDENQCWLIPKNNEVTP